MVLAALNPKCPQCGGPVDVPEGATYAHCRFCDSEAFVDLTGALLHQVIRPSVEVSRVPGLVKAHALEAGWPTALVTQVRLVYEPVWEVESTDGRRLQVSARPSTEGRFAQVRLPGGERGFVETGERDASADWIEPELAPESLAEVAARVTGRPVLAKALRLIHHPVYSGRVRLNGADHEFRLDAVSSEILEVGWPAQASYRRRTLAWTATAVMVGVAALLPLYAAAPAVIAIAGVAILVSRREGRPAAGT